MAHGRPDHAVHLYRAALDLEPNNLRFRMMLADGLVRCTQVSAAAHEYLEVARHYAAQRRDGEMSAICYRVLQLDPSQFVYMAVAEMLRRLGRRARPLCAAAAEAHLAAGRVSDGLHMLRLGAELDAQNPQPRRRLAQIYQSQHMTSDAVAQLVEAGRLLLAAGNNAEYVEVATQVLKLDPRHLDTLRELPRVHLRVGEPQQAVVVLSSLMRVSPGDTTGYEILAHAFAAIGRVPTSLSVLRRLVTELDQTGRRALADDILRRARHWRRDDASFVTQLGQLRRPKMPPLPRTPRPTTAEGTVVLDIRDLLPSADNSEEICTLESSDLIELEDAEGTMVLRLHDLSHVGPAPTRPPTPPTAHPEMTQALDLRDIELAEVQDLTGMAYDEESSELEAGDEGETLRMTQLPPIPSVRRVRPGMAAAHR